MNEGATAQEVCIQLSGAPFRTTALGRPVIVQVTSQGETATGNCTV